MARKRKECRLAAIQRARNNWALGDRGAARAEMELAVELFTQQGHEIQAEEVRANLARLAP